MMCAFTKAAVEQLNTFPGLRCVRNAAQITLNTDFQCFWQEKKGWNSIQKMFGQTLSYTNTRRQSYKKERWRK